MKEGIVYGNFSVDNFMLWILAFHMYTGCPRWNYLETSSMTDHSQPICCDHLLKMVMNDLYIYILLLLCIVNFLSLHYVWCCKLWVYDCLQHQNCLQVASTECFSKSGDITLCRAVLALVTAVQLPIDKLCCHSSHIFRRNKVSLPAHISLIVFGA